MFTNRIEGGRVLSAHSGPKDMGAKVRVGDQIHDVVYPGLNRSIVPYPDMFQIDGVPLSRPEISSLHKLFWDGTKDSFGAWTRSAGEVGQGQAAADMIHVAGHVFGWDTARPGAKGWGKGSLDQAGRT